MTIIGSSNTAITLSPTTPDVTLTGDISGSAPVTFRFSMSPGHGLVYNVVYAAVQAREAGFNILNAADIDCPGNTTLDGGIVLNAPGIVTNQGSIQGGAGLLIFGYGGDSYVKNTALIEGSIGSGLYVQGDAGIANTGTIIGGDAGVYLSSSPTALLANGGTIAGIIGVNALEGASIQNSGAIAGTFSEGILMSGDLTNTGTITGGGSGVEFVFNGSLNNAGTITASGIGAGVNVKEGALAVQNSGSIGGTYDGIYSRIVYGTLDSVINQASGRITGPENGVVLLTPAYIFNAGYIEGAAGHSSRAQGIVLARYMAGDSGIVLGAGRLNNAGTVNGGGNGVFVLASGYVFNNGLIESDNVGLDFYQTGDLNNAGTITAGSVGVDVQGDATLTNDGLIAGVTIGGIGVSAAAYAAITNNAGALISGRYGIYLAATGNVINSGTIAAISVGGLFGDAIYGANADAILNTGAIEASGYGIGVSLQGGGLLFNLGTIKSEFTAVMISGGGVVEDSGVISAKSGPAIIFQPGYDNLLDLTPGAVIGGAVSLNGVLGLAAGSIAGHISLASIQNIVNIVVADGADWQLTGTIGNTTGMFNDGVLTAKNTGIALQGAIAIYNYGAIKGGTAIETASYYIYNAGKITATGSASAGISLTGPGYIINAAGAHISGATAVALAGFEALYNYGDITGTIAAAGPAALYNYAGARITAPGISLTDGGVLYNAGLITGGGIALGGNARLTNRGTIDATITGTGTIVDSGRLTAIDLSADSANRLILSPTGKITGRTNLGGGALELKAGHKTGTIALSRLADTAQITIDSAASWDFSGTSRTGATLTNNGTIRESAADTLTLGAPVTGAGTILLGAALTLNAAADQHIAFTAPSETLALVDPAGFTGTIQNFATGDTIDLTGITLAAIETMSFTAGILTLSEADLALTFTFANPSAFANEIFTLSTIATGTALTVAPAMPPSILTPSSASPLITLHA